MNDCTFVLFGASGDLAKRKLIPALYRLYVHKRMHKLLIIGASLDDITVELLLDAARSYTADCDPVVYKAFAQCIRYQKLDFYNPQDFVALSENLDVYEQSFGMSGNRIFYLATASHFFCQITQQLASAGLAKKWNKHDAVHHRIVYEKPFGHDLASAHAINECIALLYQEQQIYRIDHYLTKELVGNIALIRFTNCVFEPLWNNRYIDNIQIILSEHVSVGSRGGYYDKYGALCDVVQNHMLEMVALLGMESPQQLTGEYIRNQRADVIKKIIIEDVLLGQYEGYLQEPGVSADSTVETFALVKLMINNSRWAGVPFYLKTGKALDKKETIIYIKFKQVDCLLAKNCPTDSNYLSIRVTPDASFSLSLNAKKPGRADDIIPVTMDFAHSKLFGPVTPESYEVIFEDVMRNEQSISVRFDEIEFAWKVIASIKQFCAPLYYYKKGSKGPQEVIEFEHKHGMKWRS